MELRFLNRNDASAYSTIRLEALECEPEAFGASAEEHRAMTLDDIVARLSSDPANNFVVGAFLGERLVGTAGFWRNKGLKERHRGMVWGVYVTREQRGKQVGTNMLRMLLERATSVEGIEQIKLAVATNQAAALKLYRSFGFESFGVERRALKVGDRYVDEEHMVLYLNGPRPQ
jgi:RimJ/RimL family protein N-acetyltransferase